jgi:TatD DNase family protein
MTTELTDTHCHIHEVADNFDGEDETRTRWKRAGDLMPDAMIASAAKAGVTRLICVGTTLADSRLAVDFVQTRPNCRASIGIHPHEAKNYTPPHFPHLQDQVLEKFAELLCRSGVVAVGECGLDYFYAHSPKLVQEKILRFQIELALAHSLPLIFHVRDAFADIWPIFDSYAGIRGVIHSFSAGRKELEQILERNLYVGLNGIMTFTKNAEQLEAAKAVPIDRLLVETDAPFLTPAPHRGTICEPKHVRVTAEFLANLRNESFESFAQATTQNARNLFGI